MKIDYPAPTDLSLDRILNRLPGTLKRLPGSIDMSSLDDRTRYTEFCQRGQMIKHWHNVGGVTAPLEKLIGLPVEFHREMLAQSKVISRDVSELTEGIDPSVVRRIVSWARQCGKSSIIDSIGNEEKDSIVNQQPEYFPSSELSDEEIERRYANLLGKKKPKFARTAADEAALLAADRKRKRKAKNRLRQNNPKS